MTIHHYKREWNLLKPEKMLPQKLKYALAKRPSPKNGSYKHRVEKLPKTFKKKYPKHWSREGKESKNITFKKLILPHKYLRFNIIKKQEREGLNIIIYIPGLCIYSSHVPRMIFPSRSVHRKTPENKKFKLKNKAIFFDWLSASHMLTYKRP